jgi:hypothetical protein
MLSIVITGPRGPFYQMAGGDYDDIGLSKRLLPELLKTLTVC